jgi:hypothetical protein
MIEHDLALQIADAYPEISGVVIAYIEGDDSALFPLHDFITERLQEMNSPFEVGKKYLICTVTLYYLGECEATSFGFVHLKNCSWVHWTGRLSELFKLLNVTQLQQRKARTEYIGKWTVGTSSIVGYGERNWILPTESHQ